MKRISYWLLSTLSALVLPLGYHTSTSGAEAAASPRAVVSTATAGSGSTSGSSGSSGSSASTITKVTVLQQPSGNPRDTGIDADALPILIQETKQAGNAQIDMVSGATVTSTGYIQSLQSALDQA